MRRTQGLYALAGAMWLWGPPSEQGFSAVGQSRRPLGYKETLGGAEPGGAAGYPPSPQILLALALNFPLPCSGG